MLSWSFDISRETDAGLSAPQASASCMSVFTSRRGDSYIIKVHDRAASISMRLARPFFGGRNPSKKNRSHGRPESTRAGTKAVAPGRVMTSIPRRRHSRDSMNPGSDMPGVPASDTSALTSPASIRHSSGSRLRCSLNLWWLAIGVLIPKCFISTAEVRVSSASTRLTFRSTLTARGVMSSRLPTGVGTM